MTLSSLLALRPKEQTAEAIATSLDNVRNQLDAVMHKITQMEADQPRLLVVGTEAEIDAAEHRIVARKREAQQISALIAGLEPRLEAARKTKNLDELRQAVAAADAKSAQFVAWWRKKYSPLAEQIAEGLRLEREAIEEIGHAERLRERMAKDADVSVVPRPTAPIAELRNPEASPKGLNPETEKVVATLGELVRLPSIDGSLRDGLGEPPFWAPVPQVHL